MKKIKLITLLLAVAAFLPALCLAQSGADLPTFGRGILACGTAPVNGTSEVQTITIGGTPTGGTFKLIFRGKSTAAISWSNNNAQLNTNVEVALRALGEIGGTNATVATGTMTAGIGTMTCTFSGNVGKLDVPQMTATNAMTGTSPTVAVSTTTPGITADGRNATTGQLLIDKTAGKLYINTSSTSQSPTWIVVGNQS